MIKFRFSSNLFCPNISAGFKDSLNAQHCLMTLIEKWKKSVDNGGAFGMLFTDLSKAFDYLSHGLLIAKLDAYGFNKNALKLVNSYLSNRKQRVKINNKYSSWSEILFRVHKVQSQRLYCSTFSYVTCFTF